MESRIDCHKRIPVSAIAEIDFASMLITCSLGFNQIDLPQYSSYEMLRQQLLLAINEGGEGFGFA
jgi:E3 ubiquitin-protein ligase HUWE1